MSPNDAAARALIEELFHAGLAAVESRSAVAATLAWRDRVLDVGGESLPVPGRLVVIAVGKAATGMAWGARDVLGDAIADGAILTKDGHAGEAVPGFHVFEAAHPVPDQRGVTATTEILKLARSLTARDVLVALISGGGSALLEAPRPPVTLEDLQRSTELLLNAGAPIQDLNAVRGALSEVKGGGLRRAAGDAICVSLILSDVLGNDPAVIASGPTINRRPAPGAALAVLSRYDLLHRVPHSVHTILGQTHDTKRRLNVAAAAPHDRWLVIGDNDAFVDAAAARAAAVGQAVQVVWRHREGEASALATQWVELCDAAADDVDVLLGGGEATVTVRGDGRGGRNTEFALAAALALGARSVDWTVASLASDGDDGAAAAAGAVVTSSSVAQMRQAGVDPAGALRRNDSARALATIGALVAPGPTGTNVNDLYVAVRNGAKVTEDG